MKTYNVTLRSHTELVEVLSKCLLILSFIIFSSCRTVKKEWIKETFAEKQELTQFAQKTQKTQETLKTEISEQISQLETFVSKSETSSTSEASSENTTVSGTIEAEEGKEKSVTFGNTTITSNGANISFETSSSKSITKEFESQLQELTQQLQSERTFNQTLQSELTSLKSEFANFVSTYESEKTTKSKQTTKRNFTLGTYLIIGAIIIVLYLLYRFREKFNFF